MAEGTTALEQALQVEHRRLEARSETTSCVAVAAVIALCYGIALVWRPSGDPAMFRWFTALAAGGVTLLLGLALLLRSGWYSSSVKYLNVALQVTLVSAVIVIDHQLVGPTFALSSLGPSLYPLVIALTALRVNPRLSLFAGAFASTQFLLLYFLVLRAGPGAAELESQPSLGWGVTAMKVSVLFGLGLIAALASRQYGLTTRRRVGDALKLSALHRVFGRYVSPSVAQAALGTRNLLAPSRRHAVIVLGDLRGFTAYCAAHPPEQVVAVLNQFFDLASARIESAGGILNKFTGDGFLALFNVPFEHPAPVPAAARACLELLREVPAVLAPHGLRLGLAVGSGEVVAGELGSSLRCEFTVIGDAVNRTARVEGLNSALGTSCLLTEDVARALPPEFRCAPRGSHPLKGLAEAVTVFELLPQT